MGKVYLVGAGPGDAGLITVKGAEKLKACDAVVYDRLATEELLGFTSPDCEKIYVGKEASKHCKSQREINDILVDCARRHDIVVRLKGGDPFVFGRGGEEAQALDRAGIAYEVVPGVTSAIAVPEYAGIPVTHRGVSRSFHVITGHTETSVGSPEYDYQTLAKLQGTLVFLMGLSNLSEIAQRLLQVGKDAKTPAAVISNGTLKGQKTVRGTLGNIAEKVKDQKLPSPAVIVIGETAGYEYLCSQETDTSEPKNMGQKLTEQNLIKQESVKQNSMKPIRVGITATDLLWKKLEKAFTGIGMQPVSVCRMNIVLTEQMQKLESELKHIDSYQWILFTSQNAVQLFFDKLKQQETDIRRLGGIRFGVSGSGTAEKLMDYGIRADFIPSEYKISVMAREFAQIVKPGEQVLLPRAAQGSLELTEILDANHIAYSQLQIYDVAGSLTDHIRYLDTFHYLVFVSASGVTAFFRELKRRGLVLSPDIKLACIGEVTAKRLLSVYGDADIVAAVNDVNGLLEAIKKQR